MIFYGDSNCWKKISTVDRFKILFFSVCYGFWVLLKRLCRWIMNNETFNSYKRDKLPSSMVNLSSGSHSYVKLKGTKLHYVEAGMKGNPLLILLHGFPDFWMSWSNQLVPFSKHFRVIAVDLKGFGDSDKSVHIKDYKVKVIIKEIQELILALGESKCTLIGHDLGAHISWYFVSQFPDMVEKFVSISCPHPNVYWNFVPNTSPFNTSWIQFCQLPSLPETEALKDDLQIIDKCYTHLVAEKRKDLIDAYKYSFSRVEDWTGPINYYRNLPYYRLKDDKCNVQVPTLLIVGNKDDRVQLESIVRSTEFVNKFILKIVESAGHYPHQQQPHVVNKLILSFITVPEQVSEEKEQSKGLITSLYGAVSNTMKYGNSFVKKTTSDIVTLPTQILKHSS